MHEETLDQIAFGEFVELRGRKWLSQGADQLAKIELTGGVGADVVIDSVGTTWPDSLRCLRKGGRCVVFGATGGEEVTLAPRALYLNQIELRGTTMGSPREFAALLQAIETGTWSPVIDSTRPLAEAAAAHERMESGGQFGKLVLAI